MDFQRQRRTKAALLRRQRQRRQTPTATKTSAEPTTRTTSQRHPSSIRLQADNKSSLSPSPLPLSLHSHSPSPVTQVTPVTPVEDRLRKVETILKEHTDILAQVQTLVKETQHLSLNSQNLEARLNAITEANKKTAVFTQELRTCLDSLNKKHANTTQSLQKITQEAKVENVFTFYASAKNDLHVYDENKEIEQEHKILKGERVQLSYPLMKQDAQVWAQYRALFDNGTIKVFWVKFYHKDELMFGDFRL